MSKSLQVNLFINDSIKFFSETRDYWWLVEERERVPPRGECFSVIGSRRLFTGQERESRSFLVSGITIVVIIAKLKGNDWKLVVERGVEEKFKCLQMFNWWSFRHSSLTTLDI